MVDQLNAPKKSESPTKRPAPPVGGSAPTPPVAHRKGWLNFIQQARFNRLSLQTKATTIALAIGTLPVLGIGAIAYSTANESITQQVVTTEENLARTLSQKVADFMNDRNGDLQVLSQLPILTNPAVRDAMTEDERKAVLQRFVDAYGVYENIALFDLKGNAMLQSDQQNIPNQAEKAYFKAALEANKILISRPTQATPLGPFVVYLTAPVNNALTNRRIAIVRAVLPVKSMAERLKEYTDVNNSEFSLVDGANQIFLSSQAGQAGIPATTLYAQLPQMQSRRTVNSRVVNKTSENGTQEQLLASYVPWDSETNLADLGWDVLLGTPTEMAFAPLRRLFWTFVLGTGAAVVVTGLLAAWLARRTTRPILAATSVVQDFGSGKLDTRLQVTSEDEVGILGQNINQMAEQLQYLLQQQALTAERSQLLSQFVTQIRRSLKREDILRTSVDEIRRFLKVERVVIYHFADDYQSGTITAESVESGWVQALGTIVADPMEEGLIDRYCNGRVWSMENIEQANLSHCHCEILQRLEVRANMVAPVLQNQELVGLLCAHQCSSPRQWTAEELEFLGQLAAQIGFALDHAEQLQQTEQARQSAESLSEERRRQKEDLQLQLLQLLGDVEGAVQGNLTVRADVTAGDIGTVADFFNSIVENLRLIVTQVKEAALQVNDAVSSDEQSVRQLAEAAMRQADETSRTLGSVQAMMGSIQTVAASAQQAAMVAREASSTAEAGGLAMDLTVHNILGLRETIGETTKKVKRLGESSQQISKVVSLINQIALQTNLLAINAGIEAARAGEESQGFAVVAEEVGELAARSASATREIEQIVATIQRETTEVVEAMEQGTTQVVEGTRLVENAKLSLEQMLQVSRQIDDLVQAISDATVSQVQTSAAVTNLMQDIVTAAGQTSESSLHVSQSLRHTVEVAKELQASVGAFKVN
jgi:twitching motility protein PilJ